MKALLDSQPPYMLTLCTRVYVCVCLFVCVCVCVWVVCNLVPSELAYLLAFQFLHS